MGGTKKKATVPIKKESKYKIPSHFDCPFCDAKKSIAVRLKRSDGLASVHCRVCRVGENRHYNFSPLEKPVDVFFRFREELMEKDHELLRAHNVETGAMAARTGLAQLAPKNRQQATLEEDMASAEPSDYDNFLSTVENISRSPSWHLTSMSIVSTMSRCFDQKRGEREDKREG
ncbi:transcription elongation factor 1 like protein [Trypanosoma brucei equiperdum]|uniref:Transcription elongation factor 1 homolog n=1 Tax=Trypanosoma brucei equiperdum TaxID=630700 RepID=A0A3L6LEU3_9TRYP|nr:transcription elongation factor 1 like protein [Trypanosoma brucei equiperdum]